MNYRLELTVELDTDGLIQAERWRIEVHNAIENAVPQTAILSDIKLVDEYGEAIDATRED